MHIASLFVRRGLFGYFGGWLSQARPEDKAFFDVFLFRATAAVLSLDEMHFNARCCVQDYKLHVQDLTIKRNRIAYWSPQLFLMFHQFTPFLSSVRFMQDMLLPMVARQLRLKGSIPASMSDAVKKISAYNLPEFVVKRVAEYWDQSGQRLRAYRVLDQHYYILCRHTFLETWPTPRLIVYLPDDPAVRSERSVTFEKKIDALPFFVAEFNTFHSFVETIAKELGMPLTPLADELNLTGVGSLDDGVRQTLALWIEDAATAAGLEMGQTEERKLYFKRLAPKRS